MNNLEKLPLLENYILENGATAKFTVPFLTRKNKFNVELQNWGDYQDLRRGIITIRQSGIRVTSPKIFPRLTHNSVIPIIYDQKKQKYRYLNKEELLELQSFPQDYQFPSNYSLTKIASLLGNSTNIKALNHFLGNKWRVDLVAIDLFCGIGGFSVVLHDYYSIYCVLAVDKNKSCQEVYQLNFPNTPFLLGDINEPKIRKKIIATYFELLCAGFPCQPFSKANDKSLGTSPELTSLLRIIKAKQPPYLLLENVPNFLVKGHKFIQSLLVNYHLQMSILNPLDLNLKQNRPRLFIWGELKKTNHE